MQIYNLIGYVVLAAYAMGCAFFAPEHIGLWKGLLVGEAYFLACWFLGGVYLADILHLGIAHKSLEFRPWFMKAVTLLNNTFGIYVDPIAWVNRHRHHHRFSDHMGDPNKLDSDGFWKTLYLCVFPYRCGSNLARDPILKSWSFRVVSNWTFAFISQGFNFWLLWLVLRHLKFTIMLWAGFRVFTLWVNMVQNFWTHDRRFGSRKYDDLHDNAMNITEWLPVTATFSACLQNNHHHFPSLLRLSHIESQFDFGFLTVKAMKGLGLVQATAKGMELPKEVPLASLSF